MSGLPRVILLGLCVCALVPVEGCSNYQTSPSTTPIPTSTGSVSPAATTFVFTGRVTAYRGEPIAGADVTITPISSGGTRSKGQTDGDGSFQVTIPDDKPLEASVSARGFFTAGKVLASVGDQQADFVLEPKLEVAVGDRVETTIRGDLLMATDYPYDGLGFCKGLPCKRVSLRCCVQKLKVIVEWTDPSAELGLLLVKDPYYPGTVDRYCCSSPIVGPYSMNFDFDVAFVVFERMNGRTPAPDDSVSFTVRAEPPD